MTLPGVAKDVQLGLDFNSLLLASGSTLPAGAAGPGWAMRLGADTRLVARSDATVLYLAPDGLEGVYTPIAGTSGYTTPAGFKNTLVKVSGGGWTLTDHATSAVSTFDTAGTLTRITDRNGKRHDLLLHGRHPECDRQHPRRVGRAHREPHLHLEKGHQAVPARRHRRLEVRNLRL